MEYTAFIWNGITVHYSGLLILLGALAAMLMLLCLRSGQGQPLLPVLLLCGITVVLAVPLCRVIHWYANYMRYPSLAAAMTDLSTGGFAPLGIFPACLAAVGILRLGKLLPDPGAMLDCIGVSGALGLSIGRMACLFSSANRSKFTLEGEWFRRLPFMVSSPLPNGDTDWRIATFCLEAVGCFLIFLLLLALFRRIRSAPRHRAAWQDGNVFLLFLTLDSAMTVVLDSTRYDSLNMRSNSFISLTQLFCVGALVLVFLLLSVRSVQSRGFCRWHVAAWALFLAAAGVAGYMEYYVQRHGHLFLTAYPIMAAGFLVTVLLSGLMLRTTRARSGQNT